jgi:glycosyltransferase involved in cell wall biosynthesis
MIDREPLPRSDNSGAQASECRCEPPRGAARAAGGLLYPANRLMIFVQEPANGEFRSKRITIMNTVQSSRVAGDITIIVPVYDTLVEHLDECMRSIFAQTVVPHEILVADDGSTLEETRTYLRGLQVLSGVRVVRSDRNIGLGPIMNRALRQVQTPFALKLDSDDIARPELMEKHAAFLAEGDEVDVVGCQSQNFGLTDIVSDTPARVTKDYVLNHRWFVGHTGVLLNKHSVLAVGGYRSMRGMAEDYELWMHMILRGYRRFYNLPDVLVDYRDLPTGLHRNFRPRWNRGMRILLKMLMRMCPDF